MESFAVADVLDDDAALIAGVDGDLTERFLERPAHDDASGLLVGVATANLVDGFLSTQQRYATSGHDALFDGGTGCRHGILDAVLLLLELHLGGRADLDDHDTAGQLGETLLELLTIPVGVGVLDLALDLADPGLDVGLGAGAVDDGGVVLGDDDPARPAEHVDGHAFELQADLFRDDGATGENGDVLQHGLAALTKSRSLHGDRRERAADAVDDERRQGLTLDVLGEHDERLARLHDLLEHRQQVVDRADLLVGDQDVRILEHRFLAVRVGDEVGRDVALVELHALGELELEAEGLALLDGDDAVLADLVHRLGDHLADRLIGGRDGGNRGNLFAGLDRTGELADEIDDLLDGLLDAALEIHGVGAGRDVAETLTHHGLGQHGGGRGAVTGHVVGLGGDFLGELGAHVLPRVVQLDFLGDRDAVVRDRGGSPLLLQHDVPALRAERHLHGVGELVDARLETATGLFIETQLFRSHSESFPFQPTMARRSRDERMRYSSPSTLISVPPNFEYTTTSPTLTSMGMRSPSSFSAPGPTASTSPNCGFSLAVSGITRPDGVRASFSSCALTTTRSPRG